MYEELLLMKKIVEYFNKLQKVNIANIINEELQKEFKKAPDFQEPEYAKDDLTTIFFRHVKLKRRQSENLLKKSNVDKSTISKVSKKSKTNVQTSIPVNDENHDNVQIDNASPDILKDTNHSILTPINTNRLSDNSLRKSQFLPNIGSTPTQSNIRVEKREATLENTIISNDSKTDQRDGENGDSDSIVFCNPSENFHQKIILDPEEFVDSYDISNFTNDYEAFMRHSQLDNYNDNNDINHVDEGNEEIQKYEPTATGNTEENNNLYGTPSGESISINLESDNSDKENINNEAQIVNAYDESFRCEQIQLESSDSLHFEPQIKSKVTNEIAIQCDPYELFTENDYEIRPNRKRFFSQDEEINKNTKKAKIVENNNIIDLDDEEKELENNQENIEIFDRISHNDSNGDARENKVSNRARQTSLSSIDTLPDEERETNVSKSRKKVVNKSAIIYKNDKKLDMKRRILLTDGWILWPRSLLSSSLKHYSENEFIEVLGLDIDAVDNMNKKDLLDRFLENMCEENLISKVHHSSKKINLYLKLSSLPEDSLDGLDIPLYIYNDNLWNKSSGPKNGRRLCAEGAPEIVKDLLNLELDFVNNYL